MPFEIRRIMFNYEEVQEAINTYGQKYNMSFPNGKLVKVTDSNPKDYVFNPLKKFRENHDEKATPLVFSFFVDVTAEHKYINLNEDFIIQALVEYCLDHNIIMPRNHYKSLDVIEFMVALELTDKENVQNAKTQSLSFEE
jgi:hypothetical protein